MWFLALSINIQHRDHYYSWEYHGKRGAMVVVLENKTLNVMLALFITLSVLLKYLDIAY